jgi:hypothetical protein
VSSV